MKNRNIIGLTMAICLSFTNLAFGIDVGPADQREIPVTDIRPTALLTDSDGLIKYSSILVNGNEVLALQGRENRDLETTQAREKLVLVRANLLCKLILKSENASLIHAHVRLSQGSPLFKIDTSSNVGPRDSSDFFKFYYTTVFDYVLCKHN